MNKSKTPFFGLVKRIAWLYGILLFILVVPAYAQRQVADYQYQYEKYRERYGEYTIARDEFLASQTLTAQTNAIEKTKTILVQRAQVMRTYLLALKYKMRDNSGIIAEEKAALSAQIDDEVGWLQNHMDDLESMKNPSLSDLFEASKRMERKQTTYSFVGNKTLSYLLIGKLKLLYQESSGSLDTLRPLVEKQNSQLLKNWVNQAQDKNFQAMQLVSQAETNVKAYKASSSGADKIEKSVQEVRDLLTQAQQRLDEGVQFQKEVLNELDKSSSNESTSSGVVN